MLHPTIEELKENCQDINRYQLALAAAKGARLITNEYVKQRESVDKAIQNAKDGEKVATDKVNKEYRDERAVKLAIKAIYDGRFSIVTDKPEEAANDQQDQ